jgi:sporulation protein YlmC with PRC-barrel domain
MKRSLPLALCLSASLLAGSLYAEHEGKGKKHANAEFKAGKACSAKHLIGARVNDAQGQKLGTIEDLVIDPASSRLQFAVIRLDSGLAQGKAFTPVPMAALRPETMSTTATEQPRVYVFTADRSKLQAASRFNVERWPAEDATVVWGPEVYSHYGMSYDATLGTGATGADVQIQTGRDYRGLEVKDSQEPPIDYTEKSIDNGTAPDGKGTFPFLHEQTDQD